MTKKGLPFVLVSLPASKYTKRNGLFYKIALNLWPEMLPSTLVRLNLFESSIISANEQENHKQMKTYALRNSIPFAFIKVKPYPESYSV